VSARVIVWTLVALLVVVGAVFLLKTRPAPQKVWGRMSQSEMLDYCGRMDARLIELERRFLALRPEGSAEDSLAVRFRDRVQACRQVMDSLRTCEDASQSPLLRERMDAAYRQAKAGLTRVEQASAGPQGKILIPGSHLGLTGRSQPAGGV